MKTWTNIDKSKWERGTWDQEPDKVQWIDEVSGLDCLAVRKPNHGAWCGYVGVPESHRYFGKHYDDCGADVHGGLTFAGACEDGAQEGEGICHVAEPGRPDKIWWLGFDCVHVGDLAPAHRKLALTYGFSDLSSGHEDVYRTFDYVKAECARLAEQLARP